MLNTVNILARHNYIFVRPAPLKSETVSQAEIATVLMNLSYYGYALSAKAFDMIKSLDTDTLSGWWLSLEPELKEITGDSRNIGDFVVYKNFPGEVLSKSEADYWIPQILMYWGFPKEYFTEEVKPRPGMTEKPRLNVLNLSNPSTLKNILEKHLASPARWKSQELDEALFLSKNLPVAVSSFGFKENLVSMVSHLLDNGRVLKLDTATDVLRLAAGLSDGDVSLREKVKFKSFNRKTRKFLLSMLNEANNLEEDVARRPEVWKRLLHNLHAGDYIKQYPKVARVVDDLYHDRLTTFNSKVESLLFNKNPEVLDLLSKRPGDFRRRLVHTLDVFGSLAVEAFTQPRVLDSLNNLQLVSIQSILEAASLRNNRVFPPKGNWNKLRIAEPRTVHADHVSAISSAIEDTLAKRLPKVRTLDAATKLIKLPSNGDVSQYSRGTVFPIPENIKFIRTASYWESSRNSVVWFDNGWNFFDQEWKNMGACCWSAPQFPQQTYSLPSSKKAAVFSGDPINTSEMKGRAAQLIDLYLDKLREEGVRYAVWNVLCYSRIPFSDAEDVFAALQWGEKPEEGNLFEPSRCQLSFPLKSKQLTKYVCLIDLLKNEMVFLDANLAGNVQSAAGNGNILEKIMPSFMEYIDSLPSVHDLFKNSLDENGTHHILYSDKDVKLTDGESAYVFRQENQDNNFTPVNLNSLLG